VLNSSSDSFVLLQKLESNGFNALLQLFLLLSCVVCCWLLQLQMCFA
jgi:hypothetical protein